MDVILVRHAVALDRAEAIAMGMLDRDRPLTPKGSSRMQRAARGLAKRAVDVSTVLTSPLLRAVETAEILQKQYKGSRLSETDTLLPEADPAWLAELLAGGAASSPALVVGHEPHLSCWAGWCLTGQPRAVFELRKGGACLLRFEDTPGPNKAKLLWLLTPIVLRRL